MTDKVVCIKHFELKWTSLADRHGHRELAIECCVESRGAAQTYRMQIWQVQLIHLKSR